MATAPTAADSGSPDDATPDDDDLGDDHLSDDDLGDEVESEHEEELESADSEAPTRGAQVRSVAGLALQWARSRLVALKPTRRIRPIDVLRVLGLARRAVPKPVEGPKAYPQWWERIAALLMLGALVLLISFALAALVGFLVVVAGFLLEQAIS